MLSMPMLAKYPLAAFCGRHIYATCVVLLVPLLVIAEELSGFSDEMLDFLLATDEETLEALGDEESLWFAGRNVEGAESTYKETASRIYKEAAAGAVNSEAGKVDEHRVIDESSSGRSELR